MCSILSPHFLQIMQILVEFQPFHPSCFGGRGYYVKVSSVLLHVDHVMFSFIILLHNIREALAVYSHRNHSTFNREDTSTHSTLDSVSSLKISIQNYPIVSTVFNGTPSLALLCYITKLLELLADGTISTFQVYNHHSYTLIIHGLTSLTV